MHLLLIWLVTAVGILLAAYLLPGIQVEDFGSALVAALVIGILDVLFGWVFKLLLFPIFWLLPNLIILLINAIMILFTGRLMRSFKVANFTNAFLAALVIFVLRLVLGA